MQLEKFLSQNRIIDLKSTDFESALGELLRSVTDKQLGGANRDDILQNLLEREKNISTYLGNSVCMPHTKVSSLKQKYIFAVGRCPVGLHMDGDDQYLNARLIFLLLAVTNEDSYLNVLASLARIFSEDETIAKVISSPDIKTFKKHLVYSFKGPESERLKVRRANSVFLAQADKIAKGAKCSAVVLMGDTFSNGMKLSGYFKGMRIVLVSDRAGDAEYEGVNEIVNVRSFSSVRLSQLKSAILVGLSKGIIKFNDKICCLGGIRASNKIDTILVMDVDREFSQLYLTRDNAIPQGVKPEVVERVIDIATELSTEGREGKPVGALFILGDPEKIKPYIKPLVLNPFFGYKPEDRNILSPFMDETVKEFSLIDGAFVIGGNGVLEIAGGLVHTPDFNLKLPGGLGARHAAAYSISLATDCLAFVVSSSTGIITMFRKGQRLTINDAR